MITFNPAYLPPVKPAIVLPALWAPCPRTGEMRRVSAESLATLRRKREDSARSFNHPKGA